MDSNQEAKGASMSAIPRHVKVDKLSKRVSQTDYLQMLGEAMKYARVEESKPVLNAKELPIQTKKEIQE
jgi:hypothetical protein